MRIAILTTDSRELLKHYGEIAPGFGTAPEALLQGFALLPEVEVHVISCARAHLVSPQKLASNIYFHSVHVPKLGWMTTGYQGCISAVRRKLRQIQPDIVHGQGTERDCAMTAVFSGFPNVLTIHGNMAELARLFHARVGSYNWLSGKLEDFAIKRTGGVLCNSHYTEGLVFPRARRTWRVANPLRAEFFEPAAKPYVPAKCILLNVGHPSPRKRQLELLQMIPELKRQGLDFEFQFIGEYHPGNPYAKRCLELIKSLEPSGGAVCLGGKTINELIKSFDGGAALVHIPTEEAFGLVVCESLARNLKLFATRVGGIQDIAGGVPNTELFATDDLTGLTAAIANWIRVGFPRATGAAKIMEDRYHPMVIARRHLEIYREVLVHP